MKEITPYQEGIEHLYGLQKYGIKFGLSKTTNLLRSFGNPHKGQRYIHIAGTNGKGSVAAFVASILKEAGLRVGFYSSPHLVRFTERFKINDEEITQEKAAALIDELRGAFAQEEPPTFFEATTAMALVYFAREKTDIAIMETGMGGRLDATNIIDPMVCVITSISMEHEFFLGSRLLDIAGEKAGIIKKGTDVLTAVTQPRVIKLFESLCGEKGAPIWRVGKDVRYRSKGTLFDYYGLKRRLHGLEPGIRGGYQVRNAALALAVTERLAAKGFDISSSHMRDGLKKTVWDGRMHVFSSNPTILLDGSHNPAAVRALAKAVKTGFTYRRLILVIGIMEDKNIVRMLGGIVPLSDYTIYTRPVYPRAANPEILAAAAAPLNKPGHVVPLLKEALKKAVEMAEPEDMIVVCGSLFTVGEAMTFFDPETYKPDSPY